MLVGYTGAVIRAKATAYCVAVRSSKTLTVEFFTVKTWQKFNKKTSLCGSPDMCYCMGIVASEKSQDVFCN